MNNNKNWEEYPLSNENEEDILSNGTFSRNEEFITLNVQLENKGYAENKHCY